MRRERSSSLASSKSKSQLISTSIRNNQPKPNTANPNMAIRTKSPSPLTKLSTSLNSSNVKRQQMNRNLSKDKSLARLSANKTGHSNKENINPNTTAKVQVSAKEKNRTIKDVRLQNTKKEGLTLSKNVALTSTKRSISQDKINIFVHPPKQQIKHQKIQEEIIKNVQQTEQEEPMLKYIPPIIQSKRLVVSDFLILQTLSESTYFRDVLALHRLTCSIYTMRIIDKQEVRNQEREQQLMESIKVQLFMNNLHVPHIQRLYTVFEDPCSIYLLMEPIAASKRLSHYPETEVRESKILKQPELAILAKQILQTLQEVHRNSLLLRTLDISFIKMYLGVVKIASINDACSLKKRKRRQSFLGIIATVPHQLAQGKQYNQLYDLWSLGLAIYQLAIGMQPFEVSQPLTAIQCLEYEIPMNLSKELGSFINGLLTEQSQRMSVSQALQHPFLKSNLNQKLLIPRDLWSMWVSN